MQAVYDLLGVPPFFWVLRGDNEVELIAVWSIRVGGTYFWAPALEFSTLLEVTEAGTILVHASCTRPTRCTPVLLGFKGVKWGSKLGSYRHCQCLRHLLWGSRSGIFDVVGGIRGCSLQQRRKFQNGSPKVGVANTGNDDMILTLTPILPP